MCSLKYQSLGKKLSYIILYCLLAWFLTVQFELVTINFFDSKFLIVLRNDKFFIIHYLWRISFWPSLILIGLLSLHLWTYHLLPCTEAFTLILSPPQKTTVCCKITVTCYQRLLRQQPAHDPQAYIFNANSHQTLYGNILMTSKCTLSRL